MSSGLGKWSPEKVLRLKVKKASKDVKAYSGQVKAEQDVLNMKMSGILC